MRRYKFEEFKNQIKNTYFEKFSKLEPVRNTSRRQRKEEDNEMLLKLAILRRDKWIKSGKLTILGARRYKLEV